MEPGMLHHTFDQDPEDELAFVWSEVYKDDASLLFHLTNPPLVKFVQEHKEYGDGFSIEVCDERPIHPSILRLGPPPHVEPKQGYPPGGYS
jgi:quinol monooxygenase YgiN